MCSLPNMCGSPSNLCCLLTLLHLHNLYALATQFEWLPQFAWFTLLGFWKLLRIYEKCHMSSDFENLDFLPNKVTISANVLLAFYCHHGLLQDQYWPQRVLSLSLEGWMVMIWYMLCFLCLTCKSVPLASYTGKLH